MVTSEDLNNAWRRGYTDGWQLIKPTHPSIPLRDASYPAGIMDPAGYFYSKGYELGQYNAKLSPP